MGKTIYENTKVYSLSKINEIVEKVFEDEVISKYKDVTVFCAGSFGRMEAHQKSDLDLFFISKRSQKYIDANKISYDLFMDRFVGIVKDVGVNEVSDKFLKVISLDDMIGHLGGVQDDYDNHFTTRMLLLLESYPLFNKEVYESSLLKSIDSYCRDYPNHVDDFRPIFLYNDIVRFWKTLCLNYENKRNNKNSKVDDKIKQKIKNFKLKYSRLNTCFATIIALSCNKDTVNQKMIMELARLTPIQRLEIACKLDKGLMPLINVIFKEYFEFLELVSLGEKGLREHFDSEEKRKEEFKKAKMYGDMVYEVLKKINEENEIIRYLVV